MLDRLTKLITAAMNNTYHVLKHTFRTLIEHYEGTPGYTIEKRDNSSLTVIKSGKRIDLNITEKEQLMISSPIDVFICDSDIAIPMFLENYFDCIMELMFELHNVRTFTLCNCECTIKTGPHDGRHLWSITKTGGGYIGFRTGIIPE